MAKRIMNSVTIYVIKSQDNNEIIGDYVYLNKDIAEKVKEEYTYAECLNVYLDSIILPFAGKYLSYISIYKGYDYGISNMYDITYTSELFSSVDLAKQNKFWQNIVKKAQANPDEFNVYNNKLCSRDEFGEDWFYGDVMEGKISAEIVKLKVIR